MRSGPEGVGSQGERWVRGQGTQREGLRPWLGRQELGCSSLHPQEKPQLERVHPRLGAQAVAPPLSRGLPEAGPASEPLEDPQSTLFTQTSLGSGLRFPRVAVTPRTSVLQNSGGKKSWVGRGHRRLRAGSICISSGSHRPSGWQQHRGREAASSRSAPPTLRHASPAGATGA